MAYGAQQTQQYMFVPVPAAQFGMATGYPAMPLPSPPPQYQPQVASVSSSAPAPTPISVSTGMPKLTEHKTSDAHRIRWNIDPRTLNSGDKSTVSPPFEHQLGGSVEASFKLMLFPEVLPNDKKASSFKKARG